MSEITSGSKTPAIPAYVTDALKELVAHRTLVVTDKLNGEDLALAEFGVKCRALDRTIEELGQRIPALLKDAVKMGITHIDLLPLPDKDFVLTEPYRLDNDRYSFPWIRPYASKLGQFLSELESHGLTIVVDRPGKEFEFVVRAHLQKPPGTKVEETFGGAEQARRLNDQQRTQSALDALHGLPSSFALK